MPKISVIVPVYQTEKYIERCLNTILNQTMKDLEIILVNDGSTDNSEAVIKQWIRNNEGKVKIQYLKKENGGLSDARNYGVKQATGKYLSFLDSDDYISPNLYENLEPYIKQGVDLIKFKMQLVDNQTSSKVEGPIFETCTGEQGYEKLCTKERYLDPACIYLYNKEFYTKNHFEYKKGTYHEDFGLTSLIILKAKTFVSVEEYGYYYWQSEQSITSKVDYQTQMKKADDLLQHYDNMLKVVEKYEISKKSKELIKRYYTNAILLKARDLEEKELQNYIKQIKQRKMYQNIKPNSLKQILKRIILQMSIKLYLKMR